MAIGLKTYLHQLELQPRARCKQRPVAVTEQKCSNALAAAAAVAVVVAATASITTAEPRSTATKSVLTAASAVTTAVTGDVTQAQAQRGSSD
jgi:hypothetical protein